MALAPPPPVSVRLKPPNGPIVDERGYPTVAWLDYLQALADRLVRIEARLTTAGIP